MVEKAKQQRLAVPKAEAFSATSGRGVQATLNGKAYLAGNAAFLAENGIDTTSASAQMERFAGEGQDTAALRPRGPHPSASSP